MSSTTSAARRLLALPVLVMALVACGADDDTGGAAAGAGDATASGTEVVIKGFSFDPMEIEVASGATVTWTNEDAAPHTIKDNGDLFPESEELAQGDTFSFTYDTPGEHPYICGIHPYMKGTVTVS
jgi:plastocyanin